MLGSKFEPIKMSDCGKKDVNVNHIGYQFTGTANSTTSYDILISDDHLVEGAEFYTTNINDGDKVSFQIVDKDNIFGYGANTVLNQFVTDWYMPEGSNYSLSYRVPYPAKVYGGLYLRFLYTNTNLVLNAKVKVNLLLHKVLW